MSQPVWKTRYTRPMTINYNGGPTYSIEEIIEREWWPVSRDGKYFAVWNPSLTDNCDTTDYGRSVFLVDGNFVFADCPTGLWFVGYILRSGQRWACIMQRGRLVYA